MVYEIDHESHSNNDSPSRVKITDKKIGINKNLQGSSNHHIGNIGWKFGENMQTIISIKIFKINNNIKISTLAHKYGKDTHTYIYDIVDRPRG